MHRVKRNPVRLLLIAAVLSLSLKGFAQAPNLIFSPVVSSGLNLPCDVVNANDGTNRLFVVQQSGEVRIVTLPGGVLQAGNFLDIPDSTDNAGEGGLLSLAFHPDFKNNRYFFVYYTTNSGDLRITRFQTQVGNPNATDETTGTVILTIPHPTNDNHNGGKLNFGPDGNLYLGIGDGGGSGDPNNNAQNVTKLLGKIIRINVDDFNTPPYYTIPSDNPFANSGTVRHEIYNIGVRNPWRWSFDRLNGDVWIADVGQSAEEEINYIPFASSAGLNYGWRCYEGDLPFNTTAGCLPQSSYFSPIYTYDHSAAGGHSVTGGYVYRGQEYGAMYGYYICVDYVTQRAWLIKPNGSGGWTVTTQTTGIPTSIVGFGESENGAGLYAVMINGTLYKVTTNTQGPLPVTLLQFTAKAFTGYNELRWKTTNELNLSHYEIEFSSDGVNYSNAGSINAINTTLEHNYSLQHYITSFNKLFYRVKSIDKDGRSTYSDIITLDSKERTDVKVYPTLITGDHLNIVSGKPVEQITFFSVEGKNVFQSRLNNISGSMSVFLPRIQNGIYIVQLKLKDEYVNEKIVIHRE